MASPSVLNIPATPLSDAAVSPTLLRASSSSSRSCEGRFFPIRRCVRVPRPAGVAGAEGVEYLDELVYGILVAEGGLAAGL